MQTVGEPAGPPPAASYRLLGPLQMLAGAIPVDLPKGNAAAALAVLLIRRNSVVSVDSMIAAVWDEDPPAAARSGVQVAVSALRRAIRDAGLTDPVKTAPPGYRLAASDDSTDLDAFLGHRTRARAAAAAGSPEAAAGLYRAALATWSGEPLADLQRHHRFAAEFAVAWDEERLVTLQERIDADLAAGHDEQVVGELLGLTRQHPLRERLWVQLITALYRVGRQAEALDAARAVRGILAEELGLDPGPELQQLERRVLRQEPVSYELLSAGRVAANPATMLQTVTEQNGPVRAVLVDGQGHRHPVGSRGLRLGRLPDNDVVVDDTRASRHHAVLTDTGTGFVVTDLQSTNGTRVDGERVFGVQVLTAGSEILIAGRTFRFELLS